MENLRNITDYQEYKQTLGNELRKTAEGFVRVGYLLKLARDTDILEGSGYSNVNEFAQAEYGLEKTQVSRFISINERFADPEQQDQLMQQYQGFGVAKLFIMLQLPDAVNEELSPNFSKSEIQAVKEEYDAEQDVTDIERMIEPVPEQIAAVSDTLGKVIVAFGEAEPELYYDIHQEACRNHRIDTDKLKEELTPSDEAMYEIRVPGAGRHSLSLKANGNNTLINMRTLEKETHSWEELAVAFTIIINTDKDPEEDWSEQYGRPFPKEELEIAPVQKKKKSKVVKAKETTSDCKEEKQAETVEEPTLHSIEPSIPEPDPKEETEPVEESEGQQETDEQLPGQDSVENHTEWLPDTMNPPAEEGKETENVENTKSDEQSDDNKKMIAGYKAGITNALKRLQNAIDTEDWEEVERLADQISWRAGEIGKRQEDTE